MYQRGDLLRRNPRFPGTITASQPASLSNRLKMALLKSACMRSTQEGEEEEEEDACAAERACASVNDKRRGGRQKLDAESFTGVGGGGREGVEEGGEEGGGHLMHKCLHSG